MTIKNLVTAAEWQARCELAAHYRMTDMIDTHISLRVPDQPYCFLINQYGVAFEKMRASMLVNINHEGHVVESYEQDKLVKEFRIKTAKQFASPLIEPILQRAWQAALSLIEHQYTEYVS